ncbi:MAG: ACP phosphodiesterase [Desulfuromonas sp.]|nr:ACP phosphodiesterase [Desulfuromonas sp.]
MNYLLHLLLSQTDDEQYVGNMIGDFVKGRLDTQFSPGIVAGLRRHRCIDAFAETNQYFLHSKQLIAPEYGLYRGIMVDMFYDHFTACHWNNYSKDSLEDFAQHIYALLAQQQHLPAKFTAQIPRMIKNNWLVAYRQPETIGRALHHISQRITRTNPLSGGEKELMKHYSALENDCHQFTCSALKYINQL